MNNEPHTDSDDRRESDSAEADLLSRVEDQLFQHHLMLRQHDHQITSLNERLALMVITMMSSVFFVVTVAAVLAVFVGVFSITEAYAYVESLVIYFMMLGALLIGFLSIVQWAIDWLESVRNIREGPPEMPAELRSESGQSDED